MEIDGFISIEIAKLAAAGFLHENRPGIVSAVVAGDTERDAFEILLVRFSGLGRAALEGCEFFLQVGLHRGLRENSGQRLGGPLECPDGRAARGDQARTQTSLRIEYSVGRGRA